LPISSTNPRAPLTTHLCSLVMALWHYQIYSRFKAIEVRDAAWATAFRCVCVWRGGVGGGRGRLVVYQIFCHIYLACKFRHFSVCLVSSGLHVDRFS